ncbi:hypothetical protein JG687_00012186 [Phytophthora cactorum]|uniref:Uncharacterized protein n=1 Tax=Phytophthora cactorum TaxID=29920 RepID=A0A8T1U3T5_9STRA|nr:hypothetical protein JG687_00012186 [Phytophthora cactorum]
MHNLKRTYKSVKKWLEDKQQLELFFSGKAAKKVESAVFKRCPHFLDLSPVFENVGHISTAAEGEEHEENVAEGANELNEEDGGSVEDTGGAQGKRKRQGDPGSRSSKRGKQQISPPSSTLKSAGYSDEDVNGIFPL